MFSQLAVNKIISLSDVKSVLDIGCGKGEQAHQFANAGKKVYAVDIYKHPGIDQHPNITFFHKSFLDNFYVHPVDCAWASHILEHQPNVNLFLKKALSMVRPGGYLAITVPPPKHNIVGGHLTIWNAGLVLYNLILAGTSCKRAMIKHYGYNTSVIVQNDPIALPELNYDNGDIEILSKYFPEGMAYQGFNGLIKEYNW